MLSDVQKKVLELIVRRLRGNHIPFQITGGLAAKAYGVKRPLYDIDIDIYKRDIPRVRKLFKHFIKKDFYHLQVENFDIYLMTLKINGVNVDISQAEESYVIGKSGIKTKIETDLSKVELIEIDDLELPIQNKKVLIKYKKILSRDVDLEDVTQIR